MRKATFAVFAVSLLLALLATATRPASGTSVNLTQNWGFEEGFKATGVGVGWKRFVLSGSPTFANTIEYFWPGAEHTEGETSQLIISKAAFGAGLYQQINGVTVGKPYAAKAAMLTFFESSAPPTHDGIMEKLLGIDPYGGTNPDSSNVVWSPVDAHDEAPWVDVRVAAVAESTTITLFVRVNCLQPVSHPSLDNQVFIDAVMLAEAPTVGVSSPEFSYSPTFTVSWENGQSAPGGYILKYDLQYKDDVNNVWTLWQDKTSDTAAEFTGIVGRTYTFRARAYEKYTAWYDIRLVGAWSDGDTTTRMATMGGVQGYVRDNRDVRMLNAAVSLMDTGLSCDTHYGGYYQLIPASPGTYDVAASGSAYASPPEVRGVELEENLVNLDFTLRPLDDVVDNGDFEDGLSSWQTVAGPTVAPSIVDENPRSGDYSLALGEGSTMEGTCAVTQALYIEPTTYLPTLSFWYRTPGSGGEGDDTLVVGIYSGQNWTYYPLSSLASADGWTHMWLDVSPYTGTAWISFSYQRQGVQDFVAYLDEISLGRASGGPLKSYFPLVH